MSALAEGFIEKEGGSSRNASLTITFDRSRQTSTQWRPRVRRERTVSASWRTCRFGEDEARTRRLRLSSPRYIQGAQQGDPGWSTTSSVGRSSPMSPTLRPENTPPSRTSVALVIACMRLTPTTGEYEETVSCPSSRPLLLERTLRVPQELVHQRRTPHLRIPGSQRQGSHSEGMHEE